METKMATLLFYIQKAATFISDGEGKQTNWPFPKEI